MGLYLEFPLGWWVILVFVYVLWFILYLSRRGLFRKTEVGSQILVGVIALIISFTLEFVGVSLDLWSYKPANWPAVLLLVYFGGGLLAYQLVKKIEEL